MGKEVKKVTEDELKQVALAELNEVSVLETEVNELQMALTANPQFTRFLELQKQVAKKTTEVKDNLFSQMESNGIKSITLNDWGKITIVEKVSAEVVDLARVNKKYIFTQLTPDDRAEIEEELGHRLTVGTKVADQTGLNHAYKLSNKLPAGTQHKVTSYLKLTPKKVKEEK